MNAAEGAVRKCALPVSAQLTAPAILMIDSRISGELAMQDLTREDVASRAGSR